MSDGELQLGFKEVTCIQSDLTETIYLEEFGGRRLVTSIGEAVCQSGLHVVQLSTTEMRPSVDSGEGPICQEVLVMGVPDHDSVLNPLTEGLARDLAEPFIDRHPHTALMLLEGGSRICAILERAGIEVSRYRFPEVAQVIPDYFSLPDQESGIMHLTAARRRIPARTAEPKHRGISEVREFIQEHQDGLGLTELDLVAYYTLRCVPQAIDMGITDPGELTMYLGSMLELESSYDLHVDWAEVCSVDELLVHAKKQLAPHGGDQFLVMDESGGITFDMQQPARLKEFFQLHTIPKPIPLEEDRSALRRVADACTDVRRKAFYNKLADGLSNGFSVFFVTHRLHTEALAPQIRNIPQLASATRDSVFLKAFLHRELVGRHDKAYLGRRGRNRTANAED
jgi:hypothetical protein